MGTEQPSDQEIDARPPVEVRPDCGVDLVEAVRRDGRWLISGLADTSRKACGAPAAKPPASSGR